jgi:phosphoribosylanthranilate isomerase
MTSKTKICGLRDFQSLSVAAQYGADFVGVVFVPGTRRCLPTDQAQTILQRFRADTNNHKSQIVGLFANQPIEEVNAIVKMCRLDYAQLCGKETIEYCKKISVQTIKVTHVYPESNVTQETNRLLQEADHYTKYGVMITLDRYSSAVPGGSGHTFNWDIAREIAQRFPIVLAGGLTPDNVTEALQQVQPLGVDVSSGVETNGTKNIKKIISFLEKVRGIESNVNS